MGTVGLTSTLGSGLHKARTESGPPLPSWFPNRRSLNPSFFLSILPLSFFLSSFYLFLLSLFLPTFCCSVPPALSSQGLCTCCMPLWITLAIPAHLLGLSYLFLWLGKGPCLHDHLSIIRTMISLREGISS